MEKREKKGQRVREKNICTGLNLDHIIYSNGRGFQRDRNEAVLSPSKNVVSCVNAYYEIFFYEFLSFSTRVTWLYLFFINSIA